MPPEEENHDRNPVLPTARLLKAVSFFVGLLLANLWCFAHLDKMLLEVLGANFVMIAVSGTAWFLAKPERDHIGDAVRGLARSAFPWVILPGLWILVIWMGFHTSVLLDGSEVSSNPSVSIRSGGADGDEMKSVDLDHRGAPVRLVVSAAPWGKEISFVAEDHLSETTRVSPWSSHTHFLAKAPSVLFRIPREAFKHLKGGKLLIEREGRDPLEFETEEGCAGLFLGPRSSIPTSFESEWKREFQANESTFERRCIEAWRAAKHEDEDLVLGETLHASYHSRVGVKVAEASYTVTARPQMKDVVLNKVTN